MALTLATAALIALPAAAQAAGGESGEKGFDEYGYNNSARVFVGTCLTWHEGKFEAGTAAAEAYCGDYANDQLVMKWNAAWDNCNDAGNADAEACAGATITNEWNGKAGGSGEVWHYKIIWVSEEELTTGATSCETCADWRDGGVAIWTHYEELMSQGIGEAGNHEFPVHAIPNGFGPAS